MGTPSGHLLRGEAPGARRSEAPTSTADLHSADLHTAQPPLSQVDSENTASVRAFAIAAVSCESEKPTPTAALAARSAAATRLTQADRGERVALVAGAGEAMVAVKLVGPDIDNLTIDNLTLTTTILEVKQKALAAMPAGGPTSGS